MGIDRIADLEAALAASERKVLEVEQKLGAVSDSNPIGVYHCDANGARTYTNHRWQEIYGLSGTQGLGDAWLRAVHPADVTNVTAAWRKTVAAGLSFDMEFRIVRPQGEVRTVRSRARPVVAGSPTSGFVGALEDMTDQRANEDRLRASEALLSHAGRLAGVGGWQVDLLTRVVTWSDKTRSIHEVGADYQPSLEGGIEFYAPEARQVVRAAVEEALRSGTSWDLELPFTSAKGRALWVRTFGAAVREGGAVVKLIGAFQDITEHRAQENKLAHERALREQSERHAAELDRLLNERSEMLDVMAHEVRQPLNNASAALQSAAAVLGEVGESEASRRVSKAQNVLSLVLASIDNTLAVASLLARPEPIQHVDTDIDTLLEVAIADMPASERARVRIERVTQTRTAPMDMSLMRLALRNLLSNALKYSPAGSDVVIRVSDSDDPLGLVLDVVDSGGAIPANILPNLFSRGARGLHPGVAAGHGLGLYIVRRVMELHGGRVEVIRNEPEGVTFRQWIHLLD